MIRKNSAWETDLTVMPVKAVFIAVRFLFIFRNLLAGGGAVYFLLLRK